VINSGKKICLIIGDPVAHSQSPAMHNAAFKALGIDSQYTFLAKQIKPDELANEMQAELHAFNICAFAVTIPHKEAIINYLDEIDETAKEIGAVNTILNKNGILIGYNTDWKGAINSLLKYTPLKNKKAAILGSGGTARAIAYGLCMEGCEVTIYSRNWEIGKKIAEQYGCKIYSWENHDEATNADIIINTTPIGRVDNASPISIDSIKDKHIIFDVNYKKGSTQLLHLAKQKNATTIDGLEMLLQQGVLQFELYTGLKAPEEAMRNALKHE